MALIQGPFSRIATQFVSGLVSIASQTFAGAKTFTSALIASAGIQLSALWNTNGASASDVAVKVGTNLADGSVNAGAKLLSLRTGLGGTELEKVYFNKAGQMVLGSYLVLTGAAGGFPAAGTGLWSDGVQIHCTTYFEVSQGLNVQVDTIYAHNGQPMLVTAQNGTLAAHIATKVGTTTADASVNAAAKLLSVRTGIWGTEVEKLFVLKDGSLTSNGEVKFNRFLTDTQASGFPAQLTGGSQGWMSESTTTIADPSPLWRFRNFGADKAFVMASGRIDQSGTDSSGTPGAATINKPTGKSAIAAGAPSVVITNSLVTAASSVIITPHARDTTCKELIAVPAAGSFTVSGTANATAALSFSWRVSNLI